MDAIFLRREDAGFPVPFTSLGPTAPGDPPAIVLSSQDLDFDNEAGLRFTGMFQWGPGSSVEFTYFGLVFHDAFASVEDPGGNLFSAFSNFGGPPFGGFAETDQSTLQSIDYESQFHNIEVNFRQRWMAPNCRYQGSCLMGVRYFQLDEDFNYFTQSAPIAGPGVPATSLTNIEVHNALTGIQIGGDLWVCVLPGLRLGGEMKAGVFGMHAAVDTTITAFNPIGPPTEPFVEEPVANDVAFVGDIDLLMTYRINYQWTLRAGYKFLFVEGVALAPENFNPEPPALFVGGASTREERVNDDGSVFYHGWTIGAEFMW